MPLGVTGLHGSPHSRPVFRLLPLWVSGKIFFLSLAQHLRELGISPVVR